MHMHAQSEETEERVIRKNIPEHFCPLVAVCSSILLYYVKKAVRELQ